MTFKKLIIASVSTLLFNTSAFAAGNISDQLHYTPPEPADLAAMPPSESTEPKTEQPVFAITPDINAYTYYKEKVNPLTNDIDQIEQGGVVEF